MPFILIWSKIKTILIKLVLNTFISVKGLIIFQNCPVLSPSEPDQLRFTHRNLTCFKSGVSQFSAISCKRPQTVPACYDSRRNCSALPWIFLDLGRLCSVLEPLIQVSQLGILDLMLFIRGRDHTIVVHHAGRRN